MTMPHTAPRDQTFPFFPPKSTERRIRHFDPGVFSTGPDSNLYKFLDALCGDGGVADQKKKSFMTRLSSGLENTYFHDLDALFANISFLARSPYESYSYSPATDMLTSDQWNEVRAKDAWYRDRIKKFFAALQLGGTPDGLKMAVQAVCNVSADIYEIWRVMDQYGLTSNTPAVGGNPSLQLGRALVPTRSEVVIVPHKQSLLGHEKRMIQQLLERLAPVDSVMTVSLQGVAMRTPLTVASAASEGSYFQVDKKITGTPVLSQIPAPELLAIDLLPSEQWQFQPGPQDAPYAAFGITQEHSSYYVMSGGARSPIDSVTYGTLGDAGEYADIYLANYGGPVSSDGNPMHKVLISEPNYTQVDQSVEYGPWRNYELADSPDNYPGGKYGITPHAAPALYPDRSPYVFPYTSQAAFVTAFQATVIAQGGVCTGTQYRYLLRLPANTNITYTPDQAVALNAPVQESTVTSSWMGSQADIASTLMADLRNPASFFQRTV